MTARMTDTKVKIADKVAALDNPLNVRGRENTSDTMAVTNDQMIVHAPWPVIVFRYLAPTKQCKP